ncbi:MAG: hypothetical protein L6W00_05935 [Lentisphaeria bacterium]|nr:MAG: hypothetical protein L6W00_05935 [Lentisphaeria bacterium]
MRWAWCAARLPARRAAELLCSSRFLSARCSLFCCFVPDRRCRVRSVCCSARRAGSAMRTGGAMTCFVRCRSGISGRRWSAASPTGESHRSGQFPLPGWSGRAARAPAAGGEGVPARFRNALSALPRPGSAGASPAAR